MSKIMWYRFCVCVRESCWHKHKNRFNKQNNALIWPAHILDSLFYFSISFIHSFIHSFFNRSIDEEFSEKVTRSRTSPSQTWLQPHQNHSPSRTTRRTRSSHKSTAHSLSLFFTSSTLFRVSVFHQFQFPGDARHARLLRYLTFRRRSHRQQRLRYLPLP